jgi:hypothetical protein
MDKKSCRVLTLTVSCLLFLSTTAQQVIAWPCNPPACPSCYTCTPTGCECQAQCGCGGRTCSGCCVCSGCSCVPGSSCPACKSCVGCSCECTSECCEDSDCGPPGCWNCVSCGCEYQCDPDKCETCVDGSCQVCGGDPNKFCCDGSCCDPVTQVCCDGSCCDKVWTKETIDSSIEPCSSCEYSIGEPMCDGTTTELESYEKCLNVGVGQGEHCECTNTWQPVGFIYNCTINWDVDKMAWCLLQGAWCVAECYLFRDPAGCANCLMEFSIDCCPGGCEICDFVEKCEKNPYSYVEEEELVFSSFGC